MRMRLAFRWLDRVSGRRAARLKALRARRELLGMRRELLARYSEAESGGESREILRLLMKVDIRLAGG